MVGGQCPHLWPDTTGAVCYPEETGGGLLPRVDCNAHGQLTQPMCFLGWKTVMPHPGNCWKECSGHWSFLADISGVCEKIFSTSNICEIILGAE